MCRVIDKAYQEDSIQAAVNPPAKDTIFPETLWYVHGSPLAWR